MRLKDASKYTIIVCVYICIYIIGIIDSIKSVQSASGWKVVVVDAQTLKIIESACKTNDILEEKVTCTYYI